MRVLITGCSCLDKASAIVPDVSLICPGKACGQGINADHWSCSPSESERKYCKWAKELPSRGLARRRLNSVLPIHGKMNLWWLREGRHRDLQKRVLESLRLKDKIRGIDSQCYCLDAEPKDSVDQDTGDRLRSMENVNLTGYPTRSSRRRCRPRCTTCTARSIQRTSRLSSNW